MKPSTKHMCKTLTVVYVASAIGSWGSYFAGPHMLGIPQMMHPLVPLFMFVNVTFFTTIGVVANWRLSQGGDS